MKQTFKNILEASLCGIIAGVGTFGLILVVIELFSEKTDYNYDIYRSKIELKYYSTKDAIIEEIGDFDEEDFVKSGISLEEYTNPDEDVIQRLVEYVSSEYDQSSVYTDCDDE